MKFKNFSSLETRGKMLVSYVLKDFRGLKKLEDGPHVRRAQWGFKFREGY
jgi:hypothetical protein